MSISKKLIQQQLLKNRNEAGLSSVPVKAVEESASSSPTSTPSEIQSSLERLRRRARESQLDRDTLTVKLSDYDAFGENLRGNVQSGLTITTRDIASAEKTRFQLFQKVRALFERYDALLCPAAPVKPFPVEWNFPKEINGKTFDDYIDWIAPGFLITLLSLPAASVPAGLTADGLPIGLQIVAARFEEPKILGLAKLVQQANPIGWPPVVG